MLIRPARSGEVDALVSTYEWLFAAPGSRPPQWDAAKAAMRLRAAIESEDAEILVADHEGTVVGICTVYDDIDSVRFGRRAWVEDLAVDPDHRSQGAGKALLDAAKAWGRARGASRLELESAETRTEAHRFYERERPGWRSISFGWDL